MQRHPEPEVPLLVPGDLLVTDRVAGGALNVLNTVVSRWLV